MADRKGIFLAAGRVPRPTDAVDRASDAPGTDAGLFSGRQLTLNRIVQLQFRKSLRPRRPCDFASGPITVFMKQEEPHRLIRLCGSVRDYMSI